MYENDSFNLAAPPGFRGLHPDLPIRVYYRRLPHWRQAGATYAVTFRLADAVPQHHQRTLKRWREIWERSHPKPRKEAEWEELVRNVTHKTEAWLDEGYGECVFHNQVCAEEVSKSLLHFQNERYTTFCFAVMPNHVHWVVRPFDGFPLEQILASTKGFVSRKVNTHLNRMGTLWEEESHDRIIRDEEHLFRVVQYIGRNPAKAGLSRASWVLWIHPEWERAGWGFRDQA